MQGAQQMVYDIALPRIVQKVQIYKTLLKSRHFCKIFQTKIGRFEKSPTLFLPNLFNTNTHRPWVEGFFRLWRDSILYQLLLATILLFFK